MPRIDQRRLPLLVVLVAVLGVLGVVVVADGWAARAAATSSGVEAVTRPTGVSAEDVSITTASVDDGAGADATVGSLAAVGHQATGEVARGLAPSLRQARDQADHSGFVQVAADHVRPVAQSAPALLVLAAVFVAIAGARSVALAPATAVARPLPLAHVRRRGPPAPAVV